MTDDFIAGGILPSNDLTGDTDFDQNDVDSDDFLDDEDTQLGVLTETSELLDIDDEDVSLEERE